MGHVDTSTLEVGATYGRPELAKMWGYESPRALARGIFTPQGQNTILLFISGDHDASQTQYKNSFDGTTLSMDGETNHANDLRIKNARDAGDEIHLFFRRKHRESFTYHGQFHVTDTRMIAGSQPSKFVLTKRP